MSKSLRKAQEITDARIQFVSLVDKAANQKTFLLKKSDDGKTATWATYGKILKADAETHHVTGVVYEPLTEDSQGNFMTEEEITKAAYWYAKHGDEVDIQHSFEPFDGAKVVETWVAKADFDLGGEQVKKGTWLMTVEVSDPNIWKSIENGDITGFSMGGVGNYSEEDTDLENVSKQQEPTGKRSLLKQLAEALGLKAVEKGAMTALYEERSKGTRFWDAFSTLQDVLNHYDPIAGKCVYESDEAKVRETLEEFSAIITDILAGGETITKALQTDQPVKKAGRKMSASNLERLKGISNSLGEFLTEFDDDNNTDKEEGTVTKQDIQDTVEKAVGQAIAKAMGSDTPTAPAPAPAAETPPAQEGSTPVTQEAIEKMVAAAVEKAMQPATPPAPEAVTAEQVEDMVAKAVAKAVEPVLKAKGLPTNLGNDTVEKAAGGEPHYLHGII